MTVDASYAWATRVARIYAFMRYCDDLSDDESIVDRVAAIARWRNDLESAFAGHAPEHPLWPAFIDSVARYQIPHQYFFDMIDGVSSDLVPRSIRTFEELYDYCYHVASVVGLTIIHIFGFDDPRALELAEKCGIAFQLTNILRDVREDAHKQRVYLPAEDLDRFHVSPGDFLPSDAFLRLMEFEAQRARKYYDESAPLVDLVDAPSRPSLRALIGIYSRLLDRIVASHYDVLARRIRVPTWEKLWLLASSRFG
jgi:phytoene synthase